MLTELGHVQSRILKNESKEIGTSMICLDEYFGKEKGAELHLTRFDRQRRQHRPVQRERRFARPLGDESDLISLAKHFMNKIDIPVKEEQVYVWI